MIKFITARFPGKCAETALSFSKYDNILYDYTTKKAYCSKSKFYQDEAEAAALAVHVQANEHAYYEHFCMVNNI